MSNLSFAGSTISICNVLDINTYYEVNNNGHYCVEVEDSLVTFVNLSSTTIEILDTNNNPFLVYPSEYLISKEGL
ncbi:hypothetical protein JCM19233_5938 [Vibrio astriarenae]|nr:hypothetical protein JCM19233_5938 [Vibrio sp. C7]